MAAPRVPKMQWPLQRGEAVRCSQIHRPSNNVLNGQHPFLGTRRRRRSRWGVQPWRKVGPRAVLPAPFCIPGMHGFGGRLFHYPMGESVCECKCRCEYLCVVECICGPVCISVHVWICVHMFVCVDVYEWLCADDSVYVSICVHVMWRTYRTLDFPSRTIFSPQMAIN